MIAIARPFDFALSPHLALAVSLGGSWCLTGCTEALEEQFAGVREMLDAGSPRIDAGVLPARDLGVDPEVPEPTLTRVTPSVGPVSGGTRVTLRGTAFTEPVTAFFGSQQAGSVVLLDPQTIAATSPPGAVGPVTVRVEVEGGSAELPEGFTYARELRLDQVSPARIPDEGGVEVTLVGRGFTPDTVVLFDRVPLRGLRILGEERMVGLAPALVAGRPEVRVLTAEGAVRRSDLVSVYGTPDIDGLAPGYGPSSGGARQELVGRGLSDARAILFGGSPGQGIDILSDDRLAVFAPALAPGVHDVLVENADALGARPAAYVAFDSGRGDLHVLGVVPARIPVGTPAVVAVVGGGFGLDTQVSEGGRRLLLRGLSPNAVEVEVPGTLSVGATTLEVLSGGSSVRANLEIYSPIQVTGVDPTSGPASGGTMVTLTGSGFAPAMEARIGDVPLADVVIVNDTTLTGRTVAGSHGPQDVVVRLGLERAALARGFRFVEPFSVVRVEPAEGSVAGNTYVSVIGRGFDPPASVLFGGVAGAEPALENGAVIGVRSPPGSSGVVDLDVEVGSGQTLLPGAFEYFNPRLITGGAWGGPVEGAVNVAVLDDEGTPVPGMTVQLGYDADPRYRGITDADGLATVSSPEIRGAQSVTVGGPDTEFVTFTDLDARNLTVFSAAHPQSPPPDAPIGPCPTGAQPPVVRGTISELKSALDPETSPNIEPRVRITYSQAGVFSPNPPEPPEQIAFVSEEGASYQIVVMRAGTVAVYAVLGDFDRTTGTFTPRRMGIARSVPVAPETVTDGIDIALNIDMDQTLRVRLDAPPEQNPGPTVNAVFPFLNLQSDGVIPFAPSVVEGSEEVILTNMPDLAESQFLYLGGSFTPTPSGQLGSPSSRTLLNSSAPFDEGVNLGPFVEMPVNVRPKLGEVLEDGIVSWQQGGPRPDLTLLQIGDSRFVGGRCCEDLDLDGVCDPDEPIRSGGFASFARWSLFAPGGRESYRFPRMPLDVQAFEPPRLYEYSLVTALVPRFSWEEFSYSQFASSFWQSWVVWGSIFTVKEETD